MKLQHLVAAISVIGLSGCASVVGEGHTQTISVATTPVGASCTFYREGSAIGTINRTPGRLLVDRRKYDIIIKCDKPGSGEATYVNHSGRVGMVAASVAADILLTMGVSSAVDSATGADNQYTSDVVIQMNVTGEMTAPPNSRPISKPVLSAI